MTSLKRIIAAAIFIFAINLLPLQANNPPPPPPDHSTTGNTPPGGGAPIGSGMALLIALGAAYGSKKVYELKKRKLT